MTEATRTPRTYTVIMLASSNPKFLKAVPIKLDTIKIVIHFRISAAEKIIHPEHLHHLLQRVDIQEDG